MPEDDIKFEIQFFESVLKRAPNYIEVIETLGCLYTDLGFIDDGLRMDELAIKIKPSDPTAHYNLACSYALLGHTDKALSSLQTSIDLGYDDLEWLLQDDDIVSLRSNTEFIKIINKLKIKLNENKC